jgi:hypothetical protein
MHDFTELTARLYELLKQQQDLLINRTAAIEALKEDESLWLPSDLYDELEKLCDELEDAWLRGPFIQACRYEMSMNVEPGKRIHFRRGDS